MNYPNNEVIENYNGKVKQIFVKRVLLGSTKYIRPIGIKVNPVSFACKLRFGLRPRSHEFSINIEFSVLGQLPKIGFRLLFPLIYEWFLLKYKNLINLYLFT